jgi:class 3 adenylate cyclase/DNA-binding CsgD family transcriptional regulator/tetratricopeptide (TPR) repeat protein
VSGSDNGLTTVVFADVEGSTALVDRVGDVAGTEAVSRQLAHVRERVESYGGREVKSLGDGLMLTFGSPRQAVSFALAAQRALAASAPRVRIGINTGEVIDTSTDPIGGAVNAAARIAARAVGGEVLVSDVVRQLVGVAPAVAFVDRGRHRLKGFSDRWHLWQAVDGSTGTPGRGTVGRVDELAVLQGFVSSLVAGAGGSVALEGEAGIGKTHLIRDAVAIARAAGVPVIELVADQVTRRTGFVPHGLIEQGRIPEVQRDHLRELLHRSGGAGDPTDLSFGIVEASVDAVESFARSAPALLIVEDVHWADDLSLAVLRSLITRSSTARFGVVVSLRPAPRSALLDRMLDSLVDWYGRHLRLGALGEIDLHALSAAITGAAPGQELRERLRATGGNPLFVSELLRSLDEEGLLRIESGVVEVPASSRPSGLNETLVRRLSWLAAETRDLLRLASLLGTSFTLADLATVTGNSVIEVAAWLREASVAGLITGDGDRLTFRHDLIRDAVYDDMLGAERRDLHRAAAQSLARAGAPTQQVARQFARGAVPGDLDAVQWLVRAADETVSIAPSSAIELYDEALALAPEMWEGRAAIQSRMIEPIAWCGQFARAERLATDVLDAAPSADVRYAALRGLSAVYGNRGDIQQAIATIQQLVAIPEAPAEESIRMQCMATQLEVLTGALDVDAGLRIGTETLTHGVEVGDATTQCLAHQVLGVINLVTGHGPDAQVHLRQGLALYDSGKVTPASYLIPDHFAAVGLVELGDLAGALAAAAAARTRYERRGALSQLPMAYVVAGFVHYSAARFDEAIAELEAGAAVVEDTGNLNFMLYAYSVLARIAIRRGDLDAAAHHIATGIARLTTGGSLFGADWLFDAQTQYLAALGDLEAASNVAELTWSQTAFLRFFYGYRERGIVAARLAVACGRADFATTVVESLEEGCRRAPIVSGRAYAQHGRGLLNGDADLLVAAVVMFRDTPLAVARASCCEDAAAALAGAGRNDEAVGLLSEAVAIHTAAGALADLERAEAALAGLGARTRKIRIVRPTFGWDALTPTELAVSELVANGLTNPEIGARLYVSRRTVETHLAHIFRKLGYGSRTQLASEFTRRSTSTS